MKWELDDNTRSGLHYLLLGALVIGALRLLWWLIFMVAYRDLTESEIAFHHGYLGLDASTLVVSGTTAAERVFAALALAFCGALTLGALAAVIRPDNRSLWFRRGVLIGMIIGIPWGVWASLLVPLKHATVAENGLVIHYHRELLFGLPLPLSGTIQPLDAEEIRELKPGSQGGDAPGSMHIEDIRIDNGRLQEVVGTVFCEADAAPSERARVSALRDDMLVRLRRHFEMSAPATDR